MSHLDHVGLRSARRARNERSGFALMTVLFVLLALLVLCAPFLMTARNADRTSGQLADRTQARLLLDAAGRHARAHLGQSHHGVPDETPFSDSIEELSVSAEFDPSFLNSTDANGAMWDLDVEDVAGLVDLNSANPQTIANLTGLVTRLSEVLDTNADKAAVRDIDALPAEDGFVWVRGEVMHYTRAEEKELLELERGVGAALVDDEEWATDGPRPPALHPVGAHVLDQRVFAPVVWRIAGADDEPREFDTIEQLSEAEIFALAGSIEPAQFTALDDLGSVHGGISAGSRWQRAVRLTVPVRGGIDQVIQVDDSRFINEGATVKLRAEGRSELRYVERREGGLIYLNRILDQDYDAYEAEVLVLTKRPVNLNTAPAAVLVALFTNLQLRGENSRITASEARTLAGLTIASRPFEGFEDWLRRLVLPCAGLEPLPGDARVIPDALAGEETAIFDVADALALYLNGLNANDASLQYATMPFTFVSRDVYEMELRASVNAPSGQERTSALRERVELIVPQNELFYLWGSQMAFDEALRLGRSAPWWASGPNATSQYDKSSPTVPPSRVWPHLGTVDGQPYLPGLTHDAVLEDVDGEARVANHVFGTITDEGWAQLWPSRVAGPRVVGRALHFDRDTSDPEGRYLPEETIVRFPTDEMIRWSTDDDSLLRSLSMSMWIKPTVGGDGVLLDVGDTSREVDRVTLAIEEGELVLRVLDGFGDHRDTSGFEEATEVRFPVAAGEDGPGLPADTWSHIEIDVAGSRPDQVGMLVNGMAHGVRTLGMSKLRVAASQGDTVISLEDAEGFPDRGVVRIGNELIEYTRDGDNLTVAHWTAGEDAGFGGRLARTRWTVEGVPENLAQITASHPAGTTVSVYGYSAVLGSNLPSGSGLLTADLGPFRVARVIGLDPSGDPEDPITVGVQYAGTGYEATNRSGLRLALADAPDSDPDGTLVMPAFNENGGYAALIQRRWAAGGGGDDFSSNPPNAPLGGVEIIRYAGYDGNILRVTARGADLGNELPRYAAADGALVGLTRTYVIHWEGASASDSVIDGALQWGMYCVPISISAGSVDNVNFLPPEDDISEFAQITELDNAELTEWFRYDTIQSTQGQLVRDDVGALLSLYTAVTLSGGPERVDLEIDEGSPPPPPGNGPGGPPPSGPPPSGPPPSGPPPSGPAAPPAPEPPPTSAPAAQDGGGDWDPLLGEDTLADYPLSRAAASAFQFRGVLGTQPREHQAGALILPVFHVLDLGVDYGRPGARDAVFVSGPEPESLGWPLVVHRGHLPPDDFLLYLWEPDPSNAPVAVAAAQPVELEHTEFLNNDIFVALQAPCTDLIARGGLSGIGATETDPRLLARITKFPSGERPRNVSSVTLGTTFDGAGGAVPSAVIDEVVFDDSRFLEGLPLASPGSHTQGASMILAADVSESADRLTVFPTVFRVAEGRYGGDPGTLASGDSGLPDDGGLLRIGEEILAYSERDANSGELIIAELGRGLLGTEEQSHSFTDPVTFLHHRVVSVLTTDIGPDDSILPIVSLDDFPIEGGTVLIGDELIHYTRVRDSALEMPSASSTPGAMDEDGGGIFRGRFGTIPTAHPANTPVILFPFRYWDRWSDRADAAELAYCQLELEQPGAWWTGLFWDTDPATNGQCQIGVLQRTDPSVPWDEDPDLSPALTLTWEGRQEDGLIPIGVQADLVEWRVFVRYDPNAFDPDAGLSHGWKDSPRLRRLGASFFAPGQVLRSVDR